MTNEDAQLREGLGKLTAKLLLDSYKGTGIDVILKDTPEFLRLSQGDFSREAVSGLSNILRTNMPSVRLVEAVRDNFNPSLARQAEESLRNKDYAGFLNLLKANGASLPVNPFCDDVKEVAKQLVGSQISTIYSPGRIPLGLITEAAAYSGEGDPAEFTLPKSVPGTLGIWRSTRRGGYGVACVSAHPAGKEGYVAIWGVTAGSEKLNMGEIPQYFGFDALVGTYLLDRKSQMKLQPRLDKGTDLTDRVSVYTDAKKGKGCLASYKLGER